MSPNVTAWVWSGRRDRAAVLVAEDLRTDEEIATSAGVTKRQLERWKAHPEFAARVDQLRAELRTAATNEGIANRQNRVAALNDRWLRMQRIIDARSTEHAEVPGGDTGLLIRQVKLVKVFSTTTNPDDVTEPDEADVLISAKMSQQVVEYAVDTGLLKEMREHEKQAAQELGQWTEKQEHSGELLVREYVGIRVEDV